MKKVLMFLLAFISAGSALAAKETFFVYDADEHDYEGRIVWSSDVSYSDVDGREHDTFIWHTLNLETGKYTTDEMRDAYIIMDDGSCEGFLAAREKDGYVTVFNVKGGYDSQILFTTELEGGFYSSDYPMTVRAYMEGYLYYIDRRIDEEGAYEWLLKRTDMNGGEYAYSAPHGICVALYKNGMCAWTPDKGDELCVETPENGIIKRLAAQEVDGAEKLRAATWLSENRLLFWAMKPGEYDGTLYTLNINTGKVRKYLDRKGGEITSGGYSPYSVMMDINEEKELVIYMEAYGDENFCEPILFDLTDGTYTRLYRTTLHVHGKWFRDVIKELTSEGLMPVWIND